MAEGAREAEVGDPNGTHHSSCNVTAAKRIEWGQSLQLAKGGCVQHAGAAAKPSALQVPFSWSIPLVLPYQAHACPSEPH